METELSTTTSGMRYYRNGTRKAYEVISVNQENKTVELRQVGGEKTWFVDAEVFFDGYTRIGVKKKLAKIPTLTPVHPRMIRHATENGLSIIRAGVYSGFGPDTTEAGVTALATPVTKEDADVVTDTLFAAFYDCRSETEQMLFDMTKGLGSARELSTRSSRSITTFIDEDRAKEIWARVEKIRAKRTKAEALAAVEKKRSEMGSDT